MNIAYCSSNNSIKYFRCAEPPNELLLENGELFGPITVAYETYGTLNADKSNGILICHALSGTSHVSSYNSNCPDKPGWWDNVVGSSKIFDPNEYFIICSNVLGGCNGTTGPSSINPRNSKHYALDFPVVSIKDMVTVQKLLIDHLEIDRLFCVAGGSMGGMQVLEWMAVFPSLIEKAIVIASTSKHSALAIALNSVGRQAIIKDPNWNFGEYYGLEEPENGLAVARMVGHISYLSEQSMEHKFGRNVTDTNDFKFKFDNHFQVESYLDHQGSKFVKRFDANSYLYITKALDDFDLEKKYGSLSKAFAHFKGKALVLSFSSDQLYTTPQNMAIVSALNDNNINTKFFIINSQFGHDSFLLESEKMKPIIRQFLQK